MGLDRALESEYRSDPDPLIHLRGPPHAAPIRVPGGIGATEILSVFLDEALPASLRAFAGLLCSGFAPGPAASMFRDRGRFGTSARHHGHMSCRG